MRAASPSEHAVAVRLNQQETALVAQAIRQSCQPAMNEAEFLIRAAIKEASKTLHAQPSANPQQERAAGQ